MICADATFPFVALNAATDAAVLMAAGPLTSEPGAGAPDWVHLLPAGKILTADNRGPYSSINADQLIAASMKGGRIPLDENHSTDLAAPRGEPAPARGWIVEMAARQDGIWGRVEWTEAGRELVSSRAYSFLSPVVTHDKSKKIGAVIRASLVNKPNLTGLVALNQESDMDKTLAEIAKVLKLAEGTAPDAILAAVTALHQKAETDGTALQAALDPIAEAAGLKPGAEARAILGQVQTLATQPGADQVTALQAQLTDVTNELNAIREATAKDKATTVVDAAIAEGRVGVKPLRDHYIARHMSDAQSVEIELKALPKLAAGTIIADPTPPADGQPVLNAEDRAVAAQLGIPEADFAKTRHAEATL